MGCTTRSLSTVVYGRLGAPSTRGAVHRHTALDSCTVVGDDKGAEVGCRTTRYHLRQCRPRPMVWSSARLRVQRLRYLLRPSRRLRSKRTAWTRRATRRRTRRCARGRVPPCAMQPRARSCPKPQNPLPRQWLTPSVFFDDCRCRCNRCAVATVCGKAWELLALAADTVCV